MGGVGWLGMDHIKAKQKIQVLINKEVYRLYGLNEEEIRIVRGRIRNIGEYVFCV